MIVMLTAVFAQTFSSTPDIRASVDPSIGSTFTIALGQSKISGLVHRAEIVDFGLEVSGTTKTGWFAYRHDHTGKIAVAHNKSQVTRFLQTRSGPQVFIDDISDLPGCGGGITATTEIYTLGGICDSVNAIDVLVPITPEAVALAGGDQTLVTSAVQAAILTSNEVYFNSELSLRVRAVDFLFLEDSEPAGAGGLLGAMSDPADGVFDEIQAARDESKADLVALISGNDYAFCGVAFLGPGPGSVWSQTLFGCLAGYTFVHELGHNMGCCHAPGDGGGCDGFGGTAQGHRWTGESGSLWRTVMAYSPGSQIPHLSNPSVLYDGVASGIEDERDSVAQIFQSRVEISGYRCRNDGQGDGVLQFDPATTDPCDAKATALMPIRWTCESNQATGFQFSVPGADLTDLSLSPNISGDFVTYLIGDTGLIFAEGQIGQDLPGVPATRPEGVVLAELTASALGVQVGFSNARVIAVSGRDIPTDGSDAITIPGECIGDIDGNGEVGFPDAVAVLGQIGQKCNNCTGDLDCDGEVTFQDFLLIQSSYGPCP
jgi:hypothetical protein